ncbi:adaptor protein MecA [Bacillus sp. AK031]
MKLERLSSNTVKFSISMAELETKGILEDEQWKDSLVWHEFFEELMDEMYNEYGIDLESTVTVEINSFNSKEMVLILTLNEEDIFTDDPFAAEEDNETFLYEFKLFEDILSFFHRLPKECEGISLYSKGGLYFLQFNKWDPLLTALVYEYGEKTNETIHTLNEYGKKIIEDNSCEVLSEHFDI